MKSLRRKEFIDIFKKPQYVVAPMVDQSDAPFRVLCKQHGATLAFTQMLNAGVFVRNPSYRAAMIDWDHYPKGSAVDYKTVDRPLIVQLAGDNIDMLIEAGQLIQDHVTAIDINLGCPQKIAKRGNYGAYLLTQRDRVNNIVLSLTDALDCPITVKIRKFDDLEETLSLCRDLESSGTSMLTVHGRTREQNKQYVGAADWETIAMIKQSVKIPVIANGGIGNWQDVVQCLAYTKADGVMSSEAILENPYLFDIEQATMHSAFVARQEGIIAEYMAIVRKFEDQNKHNDDYAKYLAGCSKSHIFKLLFRIFNLPGFADLRGALGPLHQVSEIDAVLMEFNKRLDTIGRSSVENDLIRTNGVSWYSRHSMINSRAGGGVEIH